jgi:hypothetical protein
VATVLFSLQFKSINNGNKKVNSFFISQFFLNVVHNVQLGFVVVLKRKLKTSFSKCVKGDCWENVVRKQRWFHNSRRSRAGRWEKSSHRAIFPNGFRLGDVAAKETETFYYF